MTLVGCSMGTNNATITKEQQNKIVKGIAQNYRILSIQFISFVKNKKTGSYHLKFTINDDEKLQVGLTFSNIEKLDAKEYNIGLSPIDNFVSRKE